MHVAEFGAGATFREQLEAVASADLFVSAHTSNLANALFLRPGAAVVEVLMRNWAWEGEACMPLRASAADTVEARCCTGLKHYSLRDRPGTALRNFFKASMACASVAGKSDCSRCCAGPGQASTASSSR